MTGVRIELANPNSYESPKDYVEKHLVPVVNELHRMLNECLDPGSSSVEEWAVDMVPRHTEAAQQGGFSIIDKPLKPAPKQVLFDGAAVHSLPRDVLRRKQAKVQFSGTVYVVGDGEAEFRLLRGDGDIVVGSVIRTDSKLPVSVSCTLPLVDGENSVVPRAMTYFIQGRMRTGGGTPVCRRFSLSFVYV
jgi:hypothetical protein